MQGAYWNSEIQFRSCPRRVRFLGAARSSSPWRSACRSGTGSSSSRAPTAHSTHSNCTHGLHSVYSCYTLFSIHFWLASFQLQMLTLRAVRDLKAPRPKQPTPGQNYSTLPWNYKNYCEILLFENFHMFLGRHLFFKIIFSASITFYHKGI